MSKKKKIAIAFSGGLDTTYCVAFLKEAEKANVVTVTVDTGGFSSDEIKSIHSRSIAAGATEHIFIDAKQDVFDSVIKLLIQGNVLRGNVYPLCVSAERFVQAQAIAQMATSIGADAVAHGSTGAGNDQVRFDVALHTLAPGLDIITPIRDQGLSRQQETEWLENRGIPVSEETSTYSVNAGMWGVTIGGGKIHDSWMTIPDDAYPNVVRPDQAPKNGTKLLITFDRGVPVELDGKAMAGHEMVSELNTLGACHGVGRGIHVGDTILGIKGRIAFEAPAATILIAAHRELEKLVLTRWQQFWKEKLSDFYGMLIHEAMFFDPVCSDIEAMISSSQERVSGQVRLALKSGVMEVEGTTSKYSLLNSEGATYGKTHASWNGRDAQGFTNIYGLQGQQAHKVFS